MTDPTKPTAAFESELKALRLRDEELARRIEELQLERAEHKRAFLKVHAPLQAGDLCLYDIGSGQIRTLRIEEAFLDYFAGIHGEQIEVPEHLLISYRATSIRKDGTEGVVITVPFYRRNYLSKQTAANP